MTTRSIVLSSIMFALAALAWTILADGEKEVAAPPDGLLERITALEKHAAASEAEVQADRALISMQSKQILALQEDLKAAKVSAAKATADAKTVLAGQMKANRKGVYADMISTVEWVNCERSGIEREPHLHFERARAQGFVAGLPNGHHSATHVGSIRWMPNSLIEKSKKLAAE